MAGDNTVLSSPVGTGDSIRDVQKGASGPKTGVAIIDIGSDHTNADLTLRQEKLLKGGQQVMADSLPVAIASNQSAIPTNPTGETGGVGVGAAADTAATSDTGTFSLIALIKRVLQKLTTLSGQLPAALSNGYLKVSLQESSVSQAVTAASLPLPTGAAQDATLTGGTAKSIARGGQKGSTNTNADITHTPSGANHEALDVALYDASGNQIGVSGNPVRVDPTGTTKQPATIADGDAASLGAQADAAASSDTGTFSLIALFKRALQKLTTLSGQLPAALSNGFLKVSIQEAAVSQAVNFQDTSPATANVTTQDLVSSSASGANSQSIITGAPTAGSAASFALSGQESVFFQITGTWTGTLQCEISIDGGTTWFLRGFHQAGTNYNASSVTANAAGILNTAGCTNFRIRATAAMTGTATVKAVETINAGVVYLANTPGLADGTTPSQKLAIDSSGAASENLTKVGGTTVDTNSGNKSAGTLRVVIATDQPALTTAQPVNPTGETTGVGVGAAADSAAAGDTSTASLIGLFKRHLQRITTLLGQLPSALTGSGNLKCAVVESTATVTVTGDVASGSSDSGNPLKVGAKAVNAEPTALTNAQRANLIADLVGKLITLPYANPENFVSGNLASDLTTTTSTQVIAAQAAGIRTYITQILVTNMHASVDTRVDILDGSTVLYSGFAAHGGGGFSITLPVPLRGSAATAVNVQAGTTGAQLRCAISGYKGV